MENLESLRSLVVTGGPPGTGRSTSSNPGTSQRDFEVDLDQARRGERRAQRRERTESTGKDRAEARREARAEDRRELAQAGEEALDPRIEPESAESTAPEATDSSPERVDPQAAREPHPDPDAQPTTGTSTADVESTRRGAGAAVESEPTALLLGMPFLPAPALVAQPALLASATPPAFSAPSAAAAVPAGSGQHSGADANTGNAPDEGEASPAARATTNPGAADAPRGADRAPAAADAPSPTAEARGMTGARLAEPDRTPQAQAALQTPAASAQDVEHAAAILRQVRLRLTGGTREATLQLEPARLGRLSIHLELRRGATRAEVVVEELAAFDALSRHEPELRAALADAGFAGVEVELRHAGDGAGRNPFAAPRAAPRTATAERSAPLVRTLAARLGAGEGVDTYA